MSGGVKFENRIKKVSFSIINENKLRKNRVLRFLNERHYSVTGRVKLILRKLNNLDMRNQPDWSENVKERSYTNIIYGRKNYSINDREGR